MTTRFTEKAIEILFKASLWIALLAITCRLSIHFVSHNYNLSAEANGLSGIMHVTHGDPLYPNMERTPYYIYVYCPFHAYLSSLTLRLLPVESLRAQVLIVRALSLLTLLAALVAFWNLIGRPNGLSQRSFFIAIALGISKFADYATTARNDTLSICLDILALGFALKWHRTHKPLHLIALVVACSLSLFTRQTGVVILFSTILWLLFQRRLGVALLIGGAVTAITAGWMGYFQHLTFGAMYEQVVLANVRGFRPFNGTLFDRSLLSFIASYVLFVALVGFGVKQCWPQRKDSEQQLLLISLLISVIVPCVGFLRPGGDVNYFFDAIFIGFYFCSLAVKQLFIPRAMWAKKAAILQFVLIAIIFFLKAHSATRIAFRSFEQIGKRVSNQFGPYVYFTGRYASAFDVILSDQTFHGPDVSDASFIAGNAHPKLRKALVRLQGALLDGQIRAVIVAEEGCGNSSFLRIKGLPGYGPRQVWEEWFCVYPHAPDLTERVFR